MLALRRTFFVVAFVLLAAWLRMSDALAQPNAAQTASTGGGADSSGTAAPVPATVLAAHKAKQHYLLGMQLAAKGNWSAALAEFLASRELHATGAASTNAAFCLRQLARSAQALTLYEALLRQYGPTLTAIEVRDVSRAIEQLQATIGHIEVESNVAGARVLLDGEERGTTPLAALRVDPGLHVLRVVKEGYEPLQTSLSVASGQTKSWGAKLIRLSDAGWLQVREEGGRALEVWVDSTRVGTTPWQGVLPVGGHTVALQSARKLGTAPVRAVLRSGQLTTLTLRAGVLDAHLRVEPQPISARVKLDSVLLGSGVWQGDLPTGAHFLELEAEGYLPLRRELRLGGGTHDVKLSLEREPPMRAPGTAPFALELSVGAALSRSLGGGTDASCSTPVQTDEGPRSSCPGRSLPVGVVAALRGSYRFRRRVSLEVSAGYLRMWRDLERRLRVSNATGDPFLSRRFVDQARLSMPFAGIGVSRVFFERTPLLARLTTGLGRARVQTGVQGSFIREGSDMSEELATSLVENESHVWLPFLAPEIRFGYRVASDWTLDLGIAAWFLWAPSFQREGSAVPDTGSERDLLLGNAEGTRTAGPVRLPRESAIGAYVALVPSLALSHDF